MINFNLKKHSGAAVLLIATLLVIATTMIVIFAANYVTSQTKLISNISRTQQAYEAAEAGLEFGINYLLENKTTILASPVGGYLAAFSNSSTSNVSLANGSQYTITYTNPIANNYNLIQITSVGTNNDGTATRTISQLVDFGSIVASTPNVPLVSKSEVQMSGNSKIINLTSTSTITSGSSVSISGSAQTTISTGIGSSSAGLGSDVVANNSSINSMSTSDFFSTYFGLSAATVKSSAGYTYSNLGNYDSVLNGKTGTSIWIDQTSDTAEISGSTVVGSAANPVLLIVNGSLKLTGNATIYGLVYVTGGDAVDVNTGNAKIFGALITAGDLELKGSTTITYSPTILSTLQNTLDYYAKVPGSWKDF